VQIPFVIRTLPADFHFNEMRNWHLEEVTLKQISALEERHLKNMFVHTWRQELVFVVVVQRQFKECANECTHAQMNARMNARMHK
jgi:nitrite reductase/ring-hydroxylating ferredoxin subunit